MQPLDEDWDVVIVGGGAGGYFAAITCAEECARLELPAQRILILERSVRPLSKVSISGGGRCNVTNACFEPAELVRNYPRGSSALRGAFSRFQPSHTLQWFEARGVKLKTEADGRVFPVSDRSQTVIDCLVGAANRAGVELRTHTGVAAIRRPEALDAPFEVKLTISNHEVANCAPAEQLTARKVVLATGGDPAGLRLAAALGHSIEPGVPSLFTLTMTDPRLEELAGISLPSVSLTLLADDGSPPSLPGMEQQGALLITHWGLSGPVVLRLSAWGARWLHERHYNASMAVNWLYPMDGEAVMNALAEFKSQPARARQGVFAHAPFLVLPARLWKHLVEATGIRPQENWGDLSKATLRLMADELTKGRFAIQGKGIFKEEFVTCGGVQLNEVNFKSMESRLLPGLYFAGEILDVDGLTGGFNLQSAWTTGWLAGMGLANALAPVPAADKS